MKDPWMKNLLIFSQFFMKRSYSWHSLPTMISNLNFRAVFHVIIPQVTLTERRSVLVSYQDMVLRNSRYSQVKVL